MERTYVAMEAADKWDSHDWVDVPVKHATTPQGARGESRGGGGSGGGGGRGRGRSERRSSSSSTPPRSGSTQSNASLLLRNHQLAGQLATARREIQRLTRLARDLQARELVYRNLQAGEFTVQSAFSGRTFTTSPVKKRAEATEVMSAVGAAGAGGAAVVLLQVETAMANTNTAESSPEQHSSPVPSLRTTVVEASMASSSSSSSPSSSSSSPHVVASGQQYELPDTLKLLLRHEEAEINTVVIRRVRAASKPDNVAKTHMQKVKKTVVTVGAPTPSPVRRLMSTEPSPTGCGLGLGPIPALELGPGLGLTGEEPTSSSTTPVRTALGDMPLEGNTVPTATAPQLSDEGGAKVEGTRPSRNSKTVSYKEPSVKQKMRKGFVFFKKASP